MTLKKTAGACDCNGVITHYVNCGVYLNRTDADTIMRVQELLKAMPGAKAILQDLVAMSRRNALNASIEIIDMIEMM